MSFVPAYTHCPVCSSSDIHRYAQVKDHSVSGEIFAVWECRDCSFRFTQQPPDADSIGPYYASDAYVSHTETKAGLVNKLYHIVRNFTLKSKRSLILKAAGKKSGTLLDIGAGTGAFAGVMQAAGWQVTALEPDATARENALKLHGVRLQPTDQLFALPAQSFDVITLWHVLEHVHVLHDYVDRFAVLLKPGGTLIIAVPNYTAYDAQAYGADWAAYDVPRHLWHFSPASMQHLAGMHGFSITNMLPMWFDSFYVSMLSEQYLHGKPGLIKAFWNGLLSNSKAIGNAGRCSSVIYVMKKK